MSSRAIRTEKKKQGIKKRKKYDPESLENAIKAVNLGMSKKLAAKTFNVPRGTIQFRLRKPDHQKFPGPSPALTFTEEKEIVNWIKDSSRKGFPRRNLDVKLSVAQFIKESKRDVLFKDGIPGRKWIDLFLKRNPEVVNRTPEAVTAASANLSESDIKGWFQEIEKYLIENNYFDILKDGSRVLNGDETNFQLCPKTGAVLSIVGEKNVYEVDQGTAKSALTTMFTFTANGEVTPPMVIFPNKRLPSNLANKVPNDWGIGLSESGWMKAELFHDYIKNLLHKYLVKINTVFPIILFVDGHKTHLTSQISQLCKNLQIVLIALYPNATRILQPADVSAFKPLKTGWKHVVMKWRRENPLVSLTKVDFVPLLEETITGYIKPETITNGFRATGLFPWNCEAIDYSKCIGKNKNTAHQNETEVSVFPIKMSEKEFNSIVGEKKIKELSDDSHIWSESDLILQKLADFYKPKTLSLHNINIETTPIVFIEKQTEVNEEILHIEAQEKIDQNMMEVRINQTEIVQPVEIEILDVSHTPDCVFVDVNKENVEKTPVKLEQYLIKIPTPKRKGKRNTERLPFVLTSQKWQEKDEEKKKIKEIKEERKKENARKRKENQEKRELLKKIQKNKNTTKGIKSATRDIVPSAIQTPIPHTTTTKPDKAVYSKAIETVIFKHNEATCSKLIEDTIPIDIKATTSKTIDHSTPAEVTIIKPSGKNVQPSKQITVLSQIVWKPKTEEDEDNINKKNKDNRTEEDGEKITIEKQSLKVSDKVLKNKEENFINDNTETEDSNDSEDILSSIITGEKKNYTISQLEKMFK